ncbi:MAG: DUF3489 domain-containing protein [Sphingomonadales bacterium]|jgi:hypothetical protein
MTAKAKRSPAAELQSQPTKTIGALPDRPDGSSAPPPIKLLKKSAQVIMLLETDDGATLADLCGVTGWQAHTCRAFLTGLRKKGLELDRSHRADGASVYKLMAAEVVAQ